VFAAETRTIEYGRIDRYHPLLPRQYTSLTCCICLRRAVDSARFVSQLTIRTHWRSALAITAHLGERNGGDSRLCGSDIPRLDLLFPRSSGVWTTQGLLRSISAGVDHRQA
jgi:hypothetical protein